jgi:hypothetical protein
MSREQRRTDRRAQKASGAAAGPPSRRTPVKVGGGSRFPIVPIGIAGSVLAIVLLIVYLVIQSGQGKSLSGPDKAEADQSTSIPGTYVPSQGRGHETGTYSPGRAMTPFCEGVPHSGSDASTGATPTVQPSSTSAAGTTATSNTPGATPTVPSNCYNSNPPSSGKHLNVQNKVDVGGGNILPRIPPDPNVYPPEVEVPRDAIPHILEHAGVFVGYNCKSGDTACETAVKQLTDMVNDRIDNHSDRVIMAKDSDLPENSIGISSWTRVLNETVDNFNVSDFEKFIGRNSCRFNPESFPC